MRTGLAVLLALVCGAGVSNGQEKDKVKDTSAARPDLDKKAAIAAYDAAVIGTDLFNNGKNYEACYRVYQGALIGLLPSVDHHPTVVQSVRDKLSRARTMSPGEGAGVLREALEEIQELNRAKKTLWERIGGETGARAIVSEFVTLSINDPKVNYTRGGKFPIHPEALQKLGTLLVDQISFLSGGPAKDALPELKKLHAGINFTEAEGGAMFKHFFASLDNNKLAQKEFTELAEKVISLRQQLTEEKK